ncbi:MAG: trypsin-like peptidase domain-containing protein [Gemmatimonadetes bacterium]|nr:trypsin-like peptidase domain-containing protein [Gemmatimonadota bacterium]
MLPDFTRLVDEQGSSVVNISTTQAPRRASAAPQVPGIEDEEVLEFFRRFIPRQQPPGPGGRPESRSLGSGFIMDASGLVLTNDHVIRGADRVMVTLPDGRDFEADVAGSDPVTDVAVLRLRGAADADLPVAPLGTSRGLLIGEWVVAIGNPFGNLFSNSEPTVTTGVVSALGRHIIPSGGHGEGVYLGMIQTDASINPGNSGGPLVNVLGEVVGVNSSIFTRSGGSEGLGFAIPIDRALRIAADLVRHGEVRRAWLGLDVEPVQADVWGRTRGVRVSRVVEGSPADRAGLSAGDRLLEAQGRRLMAPLDYEDVLLDVAAGEDVTLLVDGRRGPLRLRAEALPTMRAERVEALRDLQLVTVTPEVRAERGVTSEAGALVVAISPELQGQLGFQEGDVILRIGNVTIRNADEAARVFRGLTGRGQVRIYFERNGGLVVRDFYWRG